MTWLKTIRPSCIFLTSIDVKDRKDTQNFKRSQAGFAYKKRNFNKLHNLDVKYLGQ
jgi:hypothetical protein